MAKPNRSIKVKNKGEGFLACHRKVKWTVSPSAPKAPADLPFVGLNNKGVVIWWNVTPPATDYWQAHEVLGRAHAFDLLDMIHNPDAEYPDHILAHITDAMRQWSRTVPQVAAEGMTHGFFGVLSEYISTGTVAR